MKVIFKKYIYIFKSHIKYIFNFKYYKVIFFLNQNFIHIFNAYIKHNIALICYKFIPPRTQ